MEIRYASITRLAKDRNIDTGVLFKKFIEEGLIVPGPEQGVWELTEKGISLGGRYNQNNNFRDFIEWPVTVLSDNLTHSQVPTPASQKNSNDRQQQKADTEGEKYIKEFFRETGLKYEQQIPIRDLSYDSKAHRVADFYLPKYGVYVEFFGHWNTSESHKESYREKKRVYKLNKIPCVFIYPENLGYIEFSFDHRIMETLKENFKENNLDSYKRWKFFTGARENILGVCLSITALILMYIFNETGKIFFWTIGVYNFYKLVDIWRLIYIKNNYSLMRMMYD